MNMRALIGIATAAAFAFVLGAAAPAAAGKGGGGSKAKGPVAGARGTHGVKSTGVKATGGGAARGGVKATGGGPKGGAKGPKTTTTGPKNTGAKGPRTTTGGSKATAPKGGGAKAQAPTTGGAKTQAPGQAKKGATTTTPTITTFDGNAPQTGSLNRAQQQLQKNANLREKVQSRLPAGMDVMAAASDFRNLGQFVAAANVSNNLGLDFLQLKALMTVDGLSLGQAIQRLKGLDPTTSASIATAAVAQANTAIGWDGNTSTGSGTGTGNTATGWDGNTSTGTGTGNTATGSDGNTSASGSTSLARTKGKTKKGSSGNN